MAKTDPKIIGERALEWLTAVAADRRLSAPAKVTAFILARHMRATGDEAGLSYPSHSTISAMTGAPLRSVGAHIAALQDHGYLEASDRGKKLATRYRCILPSDRQLTADHQTPCDRQYAADHIGQVIGNKQPITDPRVIGSKLQSDRQLAASKNTLVQKANDLKIKEINASDRQYAADPNKDRTEISVETSGEALPAREPRTSEIRDGLQPLFFDSSEPFEDAAARALGARFAASEPESFSETHSLSPADLELMASESFEGEAWRAARPDGAAPTSRRHSND